MKVVIQIALLLFQITTEAVRKAFARVGRAATEKVNGVLDPT